MIALRVDDPMGALILSIISLILAIGGVVFCLKCRYFSEELSADIIDDLFCALAMGNSMKSVADCMAAI